MAEYWIKHRCPCGGRVWSVRDARITADGVAFSEPVVVPAIVCPERACTSCAVPLIGANVAFVADMPCWGAT